MARVDGFAVVAARGIFEARLSVRDCRSYKVFVGPSDENRTLTRQERADLTAFALETMEAFRDKAHVPSTECCFHDWGMGEPYNVGATVKCFGSDRAYVPGVILADEEARERPWTDADIAAMKQFLESALPMFLLGLQDYAGRVRAVLLPAALVPPHDIELLKSRETLRFWGQGVRMKVEHDEPQSAWRRCLEKYIPLLDMSKPGAVWLLALNPDQYKEVQEGPPDWWQLALDSTRDKNVVDRACIRFVRVEDPVGVEHPEA
jgi:hypothetical protein